MDFEEVPSYGQTLASSLESNTSSHVFPVSLPTLTMRLLVHRERHLDQEEIIHGATSIQMAEDLHGGPPIAQGDMPPSIGITDPQPYMR